MSCFLEWNMTVLFLDEVRKLSREMLKNGNMTVCLKYAIIILNKVLHTDEFAGGNYEGIKTIHVADFLLSLEY